jgi:hypothetical protein
MLYRLFALTLALITALALSACAEENPYPDQYPTTHEETIRLGAGNGDEIEEFFTAHNWYFEGEAGQTVTILVRSDGQSDPRFWLYDEEYNLLAEDDDSGEGVNATETVTLPADGTYTVRIELLALGRYNLRIDEVEQ